MLLPTVVIQCSGSGAECAGALRRCGSGERAMNALAVVVIPECLQLSRQVDRVPEKQAVQVLAPDRPDQALDEGMRDRGVRNRLDLVDLEPTQVGEPAVKAKQRIVIGAEVFR